MSTEWTNEELAYIAGFLDADGSVTASQYQRTDRSKRGQKTNYSVMFYNADAPTLRWIQSLFGGCFWERRSMLKKAHWHMQYALRIGALQDIAQILYKVIPYMRTKKAQAITMLVLVESRLQHRTPGGRAMPLTETESRLIDQIQALNQKTA